MLMYKSFHSLSYSCFGLFLFCFVKSPCGGSPAWQGQNAEEKQLLSRVSRKRRAGRQPQRDAGRTFFQGEGGLPGYGTGGRDAGGHFSSGRGILTAFPDGGSGGAPHRGEAVGEEQKVRAKGQHAQDPVGRAVGREKPETEAAAQGVEEAQGAFVH